MKIIISILLSFTLLVTGLPMTELARAGGRPEAEVIAKQNESNTQKQEEDTKKDETEKELKEEIDVIESEAEELQDGQAERKDPGRNGTVADEGERQEPEASENTGIEEAGDQESVKGEQTLEEQGLVKGDRQASVQFEINIEQSQEQGCLLLLEGEMINPTEKTGYHTTISRKVKCTHTATTISASIKCKKAANPLNPTKDELRNNVVLTGKLKGKKITKSLVADDKGGKDNTVTHFRLEVEGQEIGKQLLAGPYVCDDGYAAYAYFERHFSYCPNTDKFYKTQDSHVWLGCKGGDAGIPEYHPKTFTHNFNLYGYEPNKYTVSYDNNGGEGTAKNQSAIYDEPLELNDGKTVMREGYTLTGWNTKKNGKGTAYHLGKNVLNLTSEDGGKVTLYAQWEPNTLTVRYNANGGEANQEKASQNIFDFTHKWTYGKAKQDPANFGTFGLSRAGHSRKAGAEWNTRADGKGRSYDQDTKYELTDYAPDLKTRSREIVLYAQWEPNVYAITLDSQLKDLDTAGTGKIYKKYMIGLFLDGGCSRGLTTSNAIALPKKEGYKFRGYFSKSGEMMVDSNGVPTEEGMSRKGVTGNETWYARYDCQVGCTDYADIPCDMEKADSDFREDPEVRLAYDSGTRKALVHTEEAGCSITFTGQPSGTNVGEFQSSLGAGSASGNTGTTQDTEVPLTVFEGAAYRLKVTKGGKCLCDRLVYYKDGRFRTLVKLGEQEEKGAPKGSSIAGSAWGTDSAAYDLYEYNGCSEIKNVQAPGNVERYFHYKEVNMAYSGAGATEGKNTLEYDVSLEDMYQFRDNGFVKEKTEMKHTEDQKEYECKVRYSFQGWEMKLKESYLEKEQKGVSNVYTRAKELGALSIKTEEDIHTYQIEEPIRVLPGLGTISLAETSRGTQENWEGTLKAASGKAHAAEYINLTAKWNACPTIVVTPGEKMEFYEGEEVTKEMLTSHLTAHDSEDNRDVERRANLNDRLRIIKVSYPQSENRSQAAYEETYVEDVPAGFLLDTYYLKLEEDEAVDVLITFAVTDSAGNTTEEEIPVKVKYNHYPQVGSEDAFYYLKEEANRGEITAEALLRRASAEDAEDGDITVKLELKDFDAQVLKTQTEAKAEFPITYQVTDAYRKTTYKTVTAIVWDEGAVIAEMPKYYVRYISERYLDTLEEGSVWREPENLAYLKGILRNETPIETWAFTHEDVLAVQDWITERGEGNWKIGQQANREFLAEFAHCRQ